MNDVISEYKSGVTPKDKNQREIINKISNTEKSIHRKYNNSTGDFNNELKILLSLSNGTCVSRIVLIPLLQALNNLI